MRRALRATSSLCMLGALLCVAACRLLVGIHEKELAVVDGAGGAGGASSSAGGAGHGGGGCSTIGLDHDGKNCGVCNHDCLGGACSGGHCRPVELSVATGPKGVAVDDTWVYWADYGGNYVGGVRKNGKDSKVFADTMAPSWAKPTMVAVNATDIYYAISDEVNPGFADAYVGRVDKASGNFGRFTDDATSTWGLALDASAVFWTNKTGPTVVSWKAFTGEVTSVPASGLAATSIAAHPSYVFYGALAPQRIHRVTRGSLKDEEILSEGNLALGGVDATRFYWCQDGKIFRAPVQASDFAGESEQVGEVVTPVSAARGFAALAIDADGYGYFTVNLSSPNGAVRRFPLNGQGPTSTVVANVAEAQGIATDADAIYWAEESGHIRKVAKP